MYLSTTYQRALFWVPKPSAVLSFLGATYITVTVLRSSSKRTKFFHRIMLALALNDMVLSASFFWGTWALPKLETSMIPSASGTFHTCTAQGFLIQQHGSAVPLYYSALSLYSFIAVRNDFRVHDFCKRMEPYLHIMCNLLPLAGCIYLMKQQVFNPATAWCWIQEFPVGCEGDACLRGNKDEVWVYKLLFSGTLVVFCLGFPTVMMIALYFVEKRKEKKRSGLIGKRRIIETARRNKSNVIARQAAVYLAANYFTFTAGVISRFLEQQTGKINMNLFLLHLAVYPLQGFIYAIIYFHLQLKEKKVNPPITMNQSLKKPADTVSSLRLSCLMKKEAASKGMEINPTVQKTDSKKKYEYDEFSIFDGTNARSGCWDEFFEEDLHSDYDSEEADLRFNPKIEDDTERFVDDIDEAGMKSIVISEEKLGRQCNHGTRISPTDTIDDERRTSRTGLQQSIGKQSSGLDEFQNF